MSETQIIYQLESQYNADNDILPGLPVVTWADKQLLELVKSLYREVEELKAKVKEQDQDLRRALTMAAGESLE